MRRIINGQATFDGRTLAELVPEVVNDVVKACDPKRVILFGSVARGDEGADSDLDLLVVLDRLPDDGHHAAATQIYRALTTIAAVDVLVTDLAELKLRGDLPGVLRVAQREGRVVYERPC